jgi:HAD superfamily hydrolase (TIGR01509 family)
VIGEVERYRTAMEQQTTVTPARRDVASLDALVFDLDGLIVDTESVVQNVWLSIFERHGCSFTEEEWSHVVGGEGDFRPLDVLHERSRGPVVGVASLLETIQTQIEVRLEGIAPLPGVVSWMEDARTLGVHVGVASNSPRAWVETRLNQAGVRDLIDAVSCRDESENAKPAPDIYLKACDRLGVAPHQSVAIEDSRTGVASAKAAGLRCIAVPNGLTRRHDLSAADLIVDSLASVDFSEAIKRIDRKC